MYFACNIRDTSYFGFWGLRSRALRAWNATSVIHVDGSSCSRKSAGLKWQLAVRLANRARRPDGEALRVARSSPPRATHALTTRGSHRNEAVAVVQTPTSADREVAMSIHPNRAYVDNKTTRRRTTNSDGSRTRQNKKPPQTDRGWAEEAG
ncbi:unnamed protein product [Toxocara canis]|uniref:Uncharacterized protein n=1 Tax=Toxocara canis TaxID=6265 RepID=A0A183UGY5_TOXCA|nr:unnamed protein product [Toxocara canis]